MKTKTIHTDKKDMERTHTNCCDNSKHSLRLIRRKELQIVVTLDELFLFVANWTMIPIFFPPDPNFLLVRSRFFISVEWQVCIIACNLEGEMKSAVSLHKLLFFLSVPIPVSVK